MVLHSADNTPCSQPAATAQVFGRLGNVVMSPPGLTVNAHELISTHEMQPPTQAQADTPIARRTHTTKETAMSAPA